MLQPTRAILSDGIARRRKSYRHHQLSQLGHAVLYFTLQRFLYFPSSVADWFNLAWCKIWLVHRLLEAALSCRLYLSASFPSCPRQDIIWTDNARDSTDRYKPFSVFYHLGVVDVFNHDRPAFSISGHLRVNDVDVHVTLQSVQPSHVRLVMWVSSLRIAYPYHDNRFCVRTDLIWVTFTIALMVSFFQCLPVLSLTPSQHLMWGTIRKINVLHHMWWSHIYS